jgi:hypothetical protein
MRVSDVEVGGVYTYDRHSRPMRHGAPIRSRNSCSMQGNPARILSKKLEDVELKDGCGRTVIRRKTIIRARVYLCTADETRWSTDLDSLDNWTEADSKEFNHAKSFKPYKDMVVEARHLIWPWANEVAKVQEWQAEEHASQNLPSFKDLLLLDVIKVLEAYGFECSNGGYGRTSITIGLPEQRNAKGQCSYWQRYDHDTEKTVGRFEKPTDQIKRMQELYKRLVGDLTHATGISVDTTMLDTEYNPEADYVTPAKELSQARLDDHTERREKDSDLSQKKYQAWVKKNHPERLLGSDQEES